MKMNGSTDRTLVAAWVDIVLLVLSCVRVGLGCW